MARFFLNLRTKSTLFPDTSGIDVPTLDDARREAIGAARELLADDILAGQLSVSHSFEICNELGEVLETIPFHTAYRLD